MSGLEEVLKQRRLIGEQVASLDDFARGERHLSAHRTLKEAKHILRQMRDMKLIDYIAGANDVSDSVSILCVEGSVLQKNPFRITFLPVCLLVSLSKPFF